MQFLHRKSTNIKGFSLIELMVLVALVGIFVTMALPGFSDSLARKRIESLGDNTNYFLKLARSEAAKKNRAILVHIKKNSDYSWCLGMSGDDDNADGSSDACDCSSANSCTVDDIEKVISSSDYPDISFDTTTFLDDEITIEPYRGRANGGQLNFSTTIDGEKTDLRLLRSTMGRVIVCSPSGNSLRFSKC